MEDFKTDLDSVMDIVEQQEILEHHCVPIDYLVLVNGYDRKDRNCQKFLKPKLTEKYGNPLFVTVQQNKPVMSISRALLKSKLVSIVLDKTII